MGFLDLFKKQSSPPIQEETFLETLNKKFPNDKRTIHIISLLYDLGIVAQIKSKCLIPEDVLQEYITLLENEYGISPAYSKASILKWAQLSGIRVNLTGKSQQKAPVPNRSNAISKEVSNATTNSSEKPNIQESSPSDYPLIHGDLNDYELRLAKNGWFIKKFIGFDKSNFTIPNRIDDLEIVGIDSGAYQGCRQIERLNISEGIEEIKSGAFKRCINIRTVFLPTSLKYLGSDWHNRESGVFENTKITAIEIPSNVEQIGPYAFYGCSELCEVSLPDKIEVIPENAFSGCRKLSHIALPKNLKAISNWAFKDCGKFDVIRIPYGTKYIGYGAFGGYTSVKDTYVPPTVTEISEGSHPSDRIGNPTLRGVIHCTANSEAMRFAREHNLRCVKANF